MREAIFGLMMFFMGLIVGMDLLLLIHNPEAFWKPLVKYYEEGNFE